MNHKIKYECKNCGKIFFDWKCRNRIVCSKKCQTALIDTDKCRKYLKKYIGKRGVEHPAWKGLLYSDKRGYVRLMVGNTYRYEHDILMEKKIGRKLFPNECVHHINGNKNDNNLSNLILMTKHKHCSAHQLGIKKINNWSRKYNKCIVCSDINIPHKGNGKCRNCYNKEWRHNEKK